MEPGVGDDDVVDGGVTPSEARQPQFDDHYCRIWGRIGGGGLFLAVGVFAMLEKEAPTILRLGAVMRGACGKCMNLQNCSSICPNIKHS